MNTSIQGKTGTTQPKNDFKPFATGIDANVIDLGEYETLAALGNGFRIGLALSSELNKVMRQSSSITAALARFMAAKTEEAILDNGDIDTLSSQIEAAIGRVSSLLITEADGTSDSMTASFIPTIKELKNGLLVHVRAKTVNATSKPEFKADETGIKTIVKGNNLPLEAGDIAGAGHWLELQYDGQLDKWILQNPAKGISPTSGVPVGTIEYFATTTPPAGYLKADGSAVGRETYPELFSAIGTTFGEGDGETTFNLPDLIDRFAQGSNTPGQKVEAGLPDTGGFTGMRATDSSSVPQPTGIFFKDGIQRTLGQWYNNYTDGSGISAKLSLDNPIYGASDTVQPPALTLLPCIKVFDAATNPGLIDITELANEVASKVPYADFVGTNQNLDTSGYQSLPSGLLMQWSPFTTASNGKTTVTWPRAFSKILYAAGSITGGDITSGAYIHIDIQRLTTIDVITTTPVGTGVLRAGRIFGIGVGA